MDWLWQNVYLVREILVQIVEDERLSLRLVNHTFAQAFEMLMVPIPADASLLPDVLRQQKTLSVLRVLPSIDHLSIGDLVWRQLLSAAVDCRRTTIVERLCEMRGASRKNTGKMFRSHALPVDQLASTETVGELDDQDNITDVLWRRTANIYRDEMEYIAERVGEWGNRRAITLLKSLRQYLLYDDAWFLYGILTKNDYALFEWYSCHYMKCGAISGEYREYALELRNLDPRFKDHFAIHRGLTVR